MELKGKVKASKFDDETFGIEGKIETFNAQQKSITLKDKVGIFQSVFTMFAILLGGWWSVNTFILERTEYPHASISQKIEHHELTKDIILIRVSVDIKNTGTSQMILKESTQSLQRILPIIGCQREGKCAQKQINSCLKKLILMMTDFLGQ